MAVTVVLLVRSVGDQKSVFASSRRMSGKTSSACDPGFGSLFRFSSNWIDIDVRDMFNIHQIVPSVSVEQRNRGRINERLRVKEEN